MYKIALVNMPCAATQFASLALTQLRSVLEMQQSRDAAGHGADDAASADWPVMESVA